METVMPLNIYSFILMAVIAAAGFTAWAISSGGETVKLLALPALMIAALAVRWIRK